MRTGRRERKLRRAAQHTGRSVRAARTTLQRLAEPDTHVAAVRVGSDVRGEQGATDGGQLP